MEHSLHVIGVVIYLNTPNCQLNARGRFSLSKMSPCWGAIYMEWSYAVQISISFIYLKYNKATRSPEISREQVQKLTPQFLLYIYWIWIPTVPIYNIKWEIIVLYSQIFFLEMLEIA